jgi:hypothetical protein
MRCYFRSILGPPVIPAVQLTKTQTPEPQQLIHSLSHSLSVSLVHHSLSLYTLPHQRNKEKEEKGKEGRWEAAAAEDEDGDHLEAAIQKR